MARYFLGQCEYKWTHARGRMENFWVMRELGQELWKQVNQDGFELVLIRSQSQSLDRFCRCNIYVDVDDSKRKAFLFTIKNSERIKKLTKVQ